MRRLKPGELAIEIFTPAGWIKILHVAPTQQLVYNVMPSAIPYAWRRMPLERPRVPHAQSPKLEAEFRDMAYPGWTGC